MAERVDQTKVLDQKLGFWDLQGSAIGQIIGAGIMSLMPAAIATTGRSVVFSFLVAALITVCQAIPIIFLCSCVRLRGGAYTQMGLMAGKTFAGMTVITTLLGQFSLATYGISLASYLIPLFGWPESSQKLVAFSVLTLFFVLNLIGIDAFAKIQNALVVILVASLIMFGVMGINKVSWGTYFVEDGYFMMDGVMGMLQASATLTFATGGATIIIGFSAEAKNPVRDIPLVVITSTVFVAAMYAVIAFVAAGVLPVPEVGKTLVNVANHILPTPLYYVFIIGGAGCALASTLNNQLAVSTKPILSMCADGWLPESFAVLNKKKVPYKILTFFYVIGVIFTLSGLSVSMLTNMSQLLACVTSFLLAYRTAAIPKILPEQWNRSVYKIPQGALWVITIICCAVSVFKSYLNVRNLTPTLVIINVVFIVVAVVFGVVKGKSIDLKPSYDDA